MVTKWDFQVVSLGKGVYIACNRGIKYLVAEQSTANCISVGHVFHFPLYSIFPLPPYLQEGYASPPCRT